MQQSPRVEILKTLIAKDFRFYKVPAIAMLVLTIVFYGVVFVSVWASWAQRADTSDIPRILMIGPFYGLNIATLMLSVFGGVALAGERPDRNAEFIALLPVKRAYIILSKWIAGGAIVTAFLLFNGLVALSLQSFVGANWTAFNDVANRNFALSEAGCGICLYGIAWLFGTFLKSGPISVCISIAGTILIGMLTSTITTQLFGGTVASSMAQPSFRIYAAIFTAVGLISLTVGTAYYLRRIAP